MTAQELKNSILQLAVQGKLVPQNAEDEPTSELLKRIQAEKAIAVNAGIIKMDKKLSEITEAEIPYDIPDTWEWLRLGQLCQLLDGEKKSGVKYPYLEAKYLRGKIEGSILESGKFVKKGTRLILVDGENSGEVFFATEDGYMGSTFKVLYIPDAIYAPYVLDFLLLKKQLFRNRKTGAAIPHLNKELFFNLLIPIPPLAEQERIVAKIEELLPLAAEYDEAEQKLSTLNADFPEMLRKSILQQAVQGKLTERDFSDEPAAELLKRIRAEKAKLITEGKIKKEKPLSPIEDDEIPFDIPDNWQWVHFSELMHGISTGPFGSMLHKEDYVPDGIPVVNPANIVNGEIIPLQSMMISEDTAHRLSSYRLAIGMIVMGRRGEMGRCAIVGETQDGWLCGTGSFFMSPSPCVYTPYLILFFASPYAKSYLGGASIGETMNNLNHNILKAIPTPLPPFAEQQRIVARVEELLAMCDALK